MGNVFTVVVIVSLVGYLGVSGGLAYAAGRSHPYYGDLYPPDFGDEGRRSADALPSAGSVERGVSFKNLPL